MDELKEIHANSLYYEFMHIEQRAYREKIKFFEKNKDQIKQLHNEHETEIWYYYSLASFEIGDYRKFLKLSQPMLVKVISENVINYGKEDVYQNLLFYRAASFLNLKKYKEAEYIFKELVKIEPNNKLYSKAFYQNRFIEKIKDFAPLKLFTATMLLTIVFLCFVEVLIIDAFYPQLGNLFAILRNGFALGLFSVIIIYSAYQYFSAKQTLRGCLLNKKS